MKNLVLKKHIPEEHTELCGNYWGKMLRNKKEAYKHIYEACESTCCECI